MGSAFAITLREGFEAALIVSILLAYLKAVGRPDRRGAIWAGVLSAVGLSIVAGAVIFWTAGKLSHTAEEAFEGIVALVAVAVLTWMVFWMRRQARHIKGDLQQKVDDALEHGSTAALGGIAFVAVGREGFETALFMFAAFRASAESSALLTLTGAVLGLAVAIVIGYLVYRGGLKLNMRMFFRVTGAMILLVAAYLLNNGIHELQEIGWLPSVSGLRPAAWIGYLFVTGFLFFRPQPAPAPRPEARVTAS